MAVLAATTSLRPILDQTTTKKGKKGKTLPTVGQL